jgi:hypothetical protein
MTGNMGTQLYDPLHVPHATDHLSLNLPTKWNAIWIQAVLIHELAYFVTIANRTFLPPRKLFTCPDRKL